MAGLIYRVVKMAAISFLSFFTQLKQVFFPSRTPRNKRRQPANLSSSTLVLRKIQIIFDKGV